MKRIPGSLWFAFAIFALILGVNVIPNYHEHLEDGTIVIPVLVGIILMSAAAYTTRPKQ